VKNRPLLPVRTMQSAGRAVFPFTRIQVT
jgi:hypothetical protein